MHRLFPAFCSRVSQFRLPRVLALTLFFAAMAPLASSARAADLSTPKKAGVVFAKALMAGDMAAAKEASVGTDAEYNLVKSLGEMMTAIKRFEAAAIKKFGDEGKLSKEENKDLSAEVEASDEKIDGDKATLVNKKNPNDKHPMLLKKMGNDWKVDLSTLSTDPDAAKLPQMSKAAVTALDETTKNIETDKYKTAKEAKDAMSAAMFAAILAAQGGK